MKKEFINPELEILRFQKGADVLLTSNPGIGSGGADDGRSFSRGKHYDDEDDDF